MAVAEHRSAGLDVARIREDFPILRADDAGRHAADLPRLDGHVAEAAAGDRDGGGFLPAPQRERAPGHLPARRGGDRSVRASPGQARAVHRRAAARDDRLHPRHDRVHEPGRARVGPPLRSRGGRDPPVRDGAPLEHRALAARGQGHGRDPAIHPAHRRRPARSLGSRLAAHGADEAARDHRHVELARHAAAGEGARRGRPRGRCARARGRRPARAPRAGGRGRARLRFPDDQRPQDARPDGVGGAVRQARAPRGDGRRSSAAAT